jgi:membrane protease YdiL (CAAX protease family)
MREAAVDLLIVVAIYFASAFVGWALQIPYAGSISVAMGVTASTWRLMRHGGGGWASVGLRRPRSAWRTGLSALALYLLVVIGVAGVINPIASALAWRTLDTSAFAHVRSNAPGLAAMLVLIWTVVAFGEEMLFRGFMLDRALKIFGEGRGAKALAVVTQAALFAVGHFYLGVRGLMIAAFVGVLFGAWYVARDRNLWPLIIAHGIVDTISMVAIFAGVIPQ